MNIFHSVKKYKLSRILKCLKCMGKHTEIDPSSLISFPERIEIGNYVYIGRDCILNGRGEIVISDHTIISDYVVFISSTHRHKESNMIPYDNYELLRKIIIGKGVWIGIRAIIMPGVHLDDGCIVGAGAVVTKSFPKGSVVAGNPARLISRRDMIHFEECLNHEMTYLKMKRKKALEKQDIMVNDDNDKKK